MLSGLIRRQDRMPALPYPSIKPLHCTAASPISKEQNEPILVEGAPNPAGLGRAPHHNHAHFLTVAGTVRCSPSHSDHPGALQTSVQPYNRPIVLAMLSISWQWRTGEGHVKIWVQRVGGTPVGCPHGAADDL
jgi:hypothetical protein